MRHEKVFKRQDGSKVRVTVEFYADWIATKPTWGFVVHLCEKGKRTWSCTVGEDSYSVRRLSASEKAKLIREKSLMLASAEEVELAMLELWEKLRPKRLEQGVLF